MDVEKMVENVARAICEAGGGKSDRVWHGYPQWTEHADEAKAAIRAVLDAIREPDNAALEAVGTMNNYEAGCPTADADHREWFTAMIDELRGRDD